MKQVRSSLNHDLTLISTFFVLADFFSNLLGIAASRVRVAAGSTEPCSEAPPPLPRDRPSG